MKFLYSFYIIAIFFTQIVRLIVSEENFEDTEFSHLANKLSPMECMKLLEAIFPKKPMADEEYFRSETKAALQDVSIMRRQLEVQFFNRDNCRNKLVEWNRNLPQKSSKWARGTLEIELGNLGRPDLANYVRKNRRVVRYFNRVSKFSNVFDKRVTPSLENIRSKNIYATLPNGILKSLAKEVTLEKHHKNDASKLSNEDSRGKEVEANGKSSIVDTTTRWTAFLGLLGVVILTILATVIFALYKKNRVKFCTRDQNCLEDRCPLADRGNRFSRHDIERGGITGSSCIGRRREASRSPSLISVRGETLRKKETKTKNKRDRKCQKMRTIENRKKGCAKNCPGFTENVTSKMDKSTRKKEQKMMEKCKQPEVVKPRLEFLKFHEKIANILRKNDPSCKCCKCTFVVDEKNKNGGLKFIGGKNKNLCNDEKCEKSRLKNLAELCLSFDETSPTDETRKRCMKEKRKKKKKKKKNTRKEYICYEATDTDKEKESLKSSSDNSARSTDKKDFKSKKKNLRGKKDAKNDFCLKKNCPIGVTILNDNFN